MELRLKLADLLVYHHACSSNEEAEVIAKIVLELDDDGNDQNTLSSDRNDDVFSKKDILVENLVDNLGIEEDQARNIILNLQRSYNSSAKSDDESRDSEGSDVDDDAEDSLLPDDNDDDVDDDDDGVEYLVDGECELCDRYIKLTKHHFIPKSTWPRIQTKLLHAAEADEKGDREKALLILGPGLEDILDYSRCRLMLSSDKAVIRAILHDTCDVCRQCHTTVHRTHTNMDLALFFSTVEKLLDDEQISKFCKWASKQKTGKYNRG